MSAPARSPSSAPAGAAAVESAAATGPPRNNAGSASSPDRLNNSRRLQWRVSVPSIGSSRLRRTRIAGWLQRRDHIDFHERVAWNSAGRGDRRPNGGLGAEAALEHLVHAGVVLQVVQVDVALQDL